MGYSRILDHTRAALDRLAEQYKGKPLLEGVIRVLSTRVQKAEDVLWQLFLQMRDIDNAEGAQLDVIGKIVGQPRDGSLDPEYRKRIRARIRANKSHGTPPDLMAVFDVLWEGLYTYRYVPQYQAGFAWRILDPVTDGLINLYLGFLRDAKSAAVRGILEWQYHADADTFSFADGPGLGFGDASDPDVGGRLAAARSADRPL